MKVPWPENVSYTVPYLFQYKSAAVIMFAPNGLLHRLQYFTSTSIRDFDDEEYKIAIIPK